MNPFADILQKALKHSESAGTISIKGQLHSISSVLHPQTGFLHLQKNAHSTHLCSTTEPENVFHLIMLKIPSLPLANVILHARSVIMFHNVAMWVFVHSAVSAKVAGMNERCFPFLFFLHWTQQGAPTGFFCTCRCSTGAFHSIWLALVSLILKLSPLLLIRVKC